MTRAPLLALLLALSLPMGAAAVPSDETATAAATPSLQDTAILTLNGSSRASFTTASVDVSTAMAVQRDAAASRLDQHTLDERLENTASTEAKRTLLLESATAVEIRIASLGDDERELRTAYAEGSIDTETFVRQLALIHVRAGTLRAKLDRIQGHADEVPQFSLLSRVGSLDAALFGFEGPVRDRTLAAMQGDAPPSRVHIEVSDQGAVLSTIQDDRFVREAYRTDNRDSDTNSIGADEAIDRATELYPYAYNFSNSLGTSLDSLRPGGLFRIEILLREGFITAYMDGSTEDVFFEIQERRLDRLAPRPTVMGTDNGTRLTVNRSYPGGPLRLSVVDNASGAPLQTTVMVSGHPVETGPDGTAWTLAPSGVFQVMAVGPGGNVTVTVRPLAPTPVTGEG